MNCAEFNDTLYDYLDEMLDADAQSAAREHLRGCAECRHKLDREQSAARAIRRSLDQATARLCLKSDTLPSLQKALTGRSAAPSPIARIWQWFILSPWVRAGGAAAVVGALILCSRLISRHAPTPQTYTQVIDVPIQMQTYFFGKQNNAVLDAAGPSVAIAQASFTENLEPSK